MRDGAKLIYSLVSWFLNGIWNELILSWPTFWIVLELQSPQDYLCMCTYIHVYIHKWFRLTILAGKLAFISILASSYQHYSRSQCV